MGTSCQTVTDNRLEGGLDELVDQRGRRVVRTRSLTLGAENERELGPAGSMVVHGGMKLEQALVYRAELFDIERGIVDTAWRACRVFLIPGEMPEGVEQVTIGERTGFEVQRDKELTVQGREREQRRKCVVTQHLPEHAQ